MPILVGMCLLWGCHFPEFESGLVEVDAGVLIE